MRKTLLIPILFSVLAFAGCGQAKDHTYISMEPMVFIPPTTTTTIPPTTTTKKPIVIQQKTSRGVQKQSSAKSSSVPTGDFWARLRACESPTNSGTRYRGYYQFSQSSWKGAGGTGDPAAASLDEQTRRAQYWAAHTDPYSQWPICWRRAQG